MRPLNGGTSRSRSPFTINLGFAIDPKKGMLVQHEMASDR
jgi:hypothetical protein